MHSCQEEKENFGKADSTVILFFVGRLMWMDVVDRTTVKNNVRHARTHHHHQSPSPHQDIPHSTSSDNPWDKNTNIGQCKNVCGWNGWEQMAVVLLLLSLLLNNVCCLWHIFCSLLMWLCTSLHILHKNEQYTRAWKKCHLSSLVCMQKHGESLFCFCGEGNPSKISTGGCQCDIISHKWKWLLSLFWQWSFAIPKSSLLLVSVSSNQKKTKWQTGDVQCISDCLNVPTLHSCANDNHTFQGITRSKTNAKWQSHLSLAWQHTCHTLVWMIWVLGGCQSKWLGSFLHEIESFSVTVFQWKSLQMLTNWVLQSPKMNANLCLQFGDTFLKCKLCENLVCLCENWKANQTALTADSQAQKSNFVAELHFSFEAKVIGILLIGHFSAMVLMRKISQPLVSDSGGKLQKEATQNIWLSVMEFVCLLALDSGENTAMVKSFWKSCLTNVLHRTEVLRGTRNVNHPFVSLCVHNRDGICLGMSLIKGRCWFTKLRFIMYSVWARPPKPPIKILILRFWGQKLFLLWKKRTKIFEFDENLTWELLLGVPDPNRPEKLTVNLETHNILITSMIPACARQ